MSAPNTDQALLGLAGKAVERGLNPSWPPQENILFVGLTPEQQERAYLHGQVFRNLIDRIAPESKLHVQKVEKGLVLEVYSKNGVPEAEAEMEEPVEASEVDAADYIVASLEKMIADLREKEAANA